MHQLLNKEAHLPIGSNLSSMPGVVYYSFENYITIELVMYCNYSTSLGNQISHKITGDTYLKHEVNIKM